MPSLGFPVRLQKAKPKQAFVSGQSVRTAEDEGLFTPPRYHFNCRSAGRNAPAGNRPLCRSGLQKLLRAPITVGCRSGILPRSAHCRGFPQTACGWCSAAPGCRLSQTDGFLQTGGLRTLSRSLHLDDVAIC